MTEPTRKGPKARRQDVKAVARQLFEERGYDNVTTKDIAEAAGLSRALIYRYNISKSDLLSQLLRDLIEEQGAALRRNKLNMKSPEAMILGHFEQLFLLDMSQVTLRRLAVQHSWSWGASTEEEFYLRLGVIFEPLDEPLRERWGIDLHEPARLALWAIYTEALRGYLARAGGTAASPVLEEWKSAFEPSATLVIVALKHPAP